uniref:PspA/IM30 family protein n=1 Tax=Rhodosorus marinus TaxID=101924 RepID=A0A7S0BK35_9RHOD|mmetsp:Transcript_18820/g.27207  ORF Transcript_18820/g.27207 Transcript_18820/m.27207 type:complete len:297 (+) Transcript_18820:133-1023(+)
MEKKSPAFVVLSGGRITRPAPVIGKSSFVDRVCAAPTPMATVNSRSRVQMNIVERFFRVVRANANKVVSGLEDPEKMITQAVGEMERDLIKVRQAYAEVFATTKRLEKQKEQATTMSAEWYKRAQLALEKGDENLAREALTRKKQFEETAKAVTVQLEPMLVNVGKLNGSMQTLEGKISEARAQKDQYVARARTAQTTQKVNEMLGNVGVSSSMAAFEKMKDKVEELEVSSEVSAELASSTDKTLEQKFLELEKGSGVDDELAKMKNQLGTGQKWSLPADASVDNELEKMKKERGY